MSDALSAEDLVGTWRLLDWRSVGEDGLSHEPFGPEPIGYVVYTTDRHMITTISAADRLPNSSDLLTGPPPARLEALRTFLAYSGTFDVDGGEVIHRVEMSLFPDWVGTEQRRRVELTPDGTGLTLSSGLIAAAGRTGRHILRWERVED